MESRQVKLDIIWILGAVKRKHDLFRDKRAGMTIRSHLRSFSRICGSCGVLISLGQLCRNVYFVSWDKRIFMLSWVSGRGKALRQRERSKALNLLAPASIWRRRRLGVDLAPRRRFGAGVDSASIWLTPILDYGSRKGLTTKEHQKSVYWSLLGYCIIWFVNAGL